MITFIEILAWGIIISIGIGVLTGIVWLLKWTCIFIREAFEDSIFLGFFSLALVIFFVCMVLLYCVEKYLEIKQ